MNCLFRWAMMLVIVLVFSGGGLNAAQAADLSLKQRYAAELAAEGSLAILIDKDTQTLSIYDKGQVVKTFRCVFGVNPNGDKEHLGDNKTPVGRFYVTDKETLNGDPVLGNKWIGLSYPDVQHAETGLRKGLISSDQYWAIANANSEHRMPPQNTALGGWIGIHGAHEDLTREGVNWTEGCIALLDSDLQELFSLLRVGTPVLIVG